MNEYRIFTDSACDISAELLWGMEAETDGRTPKIHLSHRERRGVEA